jgi:DNA polymerase-3 subunit delta'
MERVLGQARAVDVLMAAMRSRRLHHAYIFHGPVGVGKFTTAAAFAKLLLCPQAQPDLAGQIRACGSCESCRLLERDNHPDLHIIRKELAATSSITQLRTRKQTNIPIDVLREHIVGGTTGDGKFHDAVAYKAPLMRHHKVFIIDEAHLIDPIGQNSLLKTLEEPPAGTFLILVTARQERLLPTVRSRCQGIAFVPLPDDIIARWLREQPVELDDKSRQWLIGYCEGSLGRAQLAVACELHLWARTVLPALADMARGRCPAMLGSAMAQMIDDFAKNWVSHHANASKEAANKQAVTLLFSLIAHEARLRLAADAAATVPDDPEAAEEVLAPWLTVIDALGEAQFHINSNVNISIVCDHLVSRIDRALAPCAAGAG